VGNARRKIPWLA